MRDTVVKKGTKIDNSAHIAHNAIIGEHCLIHASVNVCGSVKIGNRCEVFVGSNIHPHVKICDDVVISDLAVVREDITESGVYVYAGNGKLRKISDKIV